MITAVPVVSPMVAHHYTRRLQNTLRHLQSSGAEDHTADAVLKHAAVAEATRAPPVIKQVVAQILRLPEV